MLAAAVQSHRKLIRISENTEIACYLCLRKAEKYTLQRAALPTFLSHFTRLPRVGGGEGGGGRGVGTGATRHKQIHSGILPPAHGNQK
jgi:hypothetical protein